MYRSSYYRQFRTIYRFKKILNRIGKTTVVTVIQISNITNSMPLKIFQVDAFTNKPFSGNPAAVCILPEPQDEVWMQNVAREMNLSETAFLYKKEDGYDLRWFTPTIEVDLCGHATLASAHLLWEEGHLSPEETIRFYTHSGQLMATRQEDWIELDFPAEPAESVPMPAGLAEAL